MAYGFLDIASTASVKEAQRENGSADYWACFHGERSFDRFTENEAAFIAARDSFYVATVSESGWPYVQHRGGPAGFLRVLDEKTIGFVDFAGNKQFITQGNLSENPKAYLFLIDYARRRRIKIWGEARVVEGDAELMKTLMPENYRARPEQVILFTVKAWDVNCPQHADVLRRGHPGGGR